MAKLLIQGIFVKSMEKFFINFIKFYGYNEYGYNEFTDRVNR